MWPGIKMPFDNENVTKEDLLQFQFALNRMLQWAFANIRDNQIIDLTAAKITDLDVENLVSETTIINNLYAETGRIAELTVDQLETSTKVAKYLASSTADVNYIRIYEQNIEFIEATTDGLSTETVQNRDGEDLYWTKDPSLPDDPEDPRGITTEVTAWPVTQYVYTELTKLKILFDTIDGVYTPYIQMGAGTGVGDNAKAFLYKGLNGFKLKYITTAGTEKEFLFDDNGTFISGREPTDIQMYNDGMSVTYDDGSTKEFTAAYDVDGNLTQLVNSTDSITTNITWNGTDKTPTNNVLYIIGGRDSSSYQDTDEYNPDVWTNKTDMPTPARRSMPAASLASIVYVFGGYSTAALSDTDEYNPDTWTSKTAMVSPARYDQAGTAVDDACYVFGGITTTTSLSDTDEYDPDVWTSKTAMVSPSRRIHSSATIGGAGYIVGGIDTTSNFRDTDEYNPDVWTNKTDMPAPARRSINMFTLSSKIYACGGYDGTNRLQDTDEYDPDTWTSKTNTPAPARQSGAAAALNTAGYNCGGYSGSASLQDNDQYTVDTWASQTSMPSPARRNLPGAAV